MISQQMLKTSRKRVCSGFWPEHGMRHFVMFDCRLSGSRVSHADCMSSRSVGHERKAFASIFEVLGNMLVQS